MDKGPVSVNIQSSGGSALAGLTKLVMGVGGGEAEKDVTVFVRKEPKYEQTL